VTEVGIKRNERDVFGYLKAPALSCSVRQKSVRKFILLKDKKSGENRQEIEVVRQDSSREEDCASFRSSGRFLWE
jgi:hypothetical protein